MPKMADYRTGPSSAGANGVQRQGELARTPFVTHLQPRAASAPSWTAEQRIETLSKSNEIALALWRIVDVAIALCVLFATLPLLLVIAAVIRLDSPGPALFFQHRLGRGARPFRFVKFRTMHVDARQRFPELYAYQYDEGEIQSIRFKVSNDPRVTRFGRWLRVTSIDELPNCWNVLTGDMSLVGPRPEIPEMLTYYHGDDQRKFAVRPGITGLAQTRGRGDLTFRETVRLDCVYVRDRSVALNIKVLWRTVRMVLAGHGAF